MVFIFLFKPYVKIMFDNNGKKNGEIHYKNYFKSSGYKIIWYYENGQIKEEASFKNNKFDGDRTLYFPNGNLKFKSAYVDGLNNGFTYSYDENNFLKSKSFWKNGRQFGDAIYFFSNGKIKLYNSIEFSGKNFYVLQFDTLGKVATDDGVIFCPSVLIINTVTHDSLFRTKEEKQFLSSQTQLQIVTASPPGKKLFISYKLIKGNKIVKTDTLPIINNIVDFNGSFYPFGFDFVIEAFIIDSNNNKIKVDSIKGTMV